MPDRHEFWNNHPTLKLACGLILSTGLVLFAVHIFLQGYFRFGGGRDEPGELINSHTNPLFFWGVVLSAFAIGLIGFFGSIASYKNQRSD